MVGDGFWRLATFTLKPFFRTILRLEIRGRENIPRTGPLLLVSNHQSFWDIPALGSAQPRTIRFMAKRELFRVPVFGPIALWGGAFPVNRGTADREAMRTVQETLREGGAVVIYIEGHRYEEFGEAKAGAGRFAVAERAPVVHVAVRDARGWRPGRRVRIVFGEPVTYDAAGRRPRDAYRETADAMLAEIRRLYASLGDG